IRCQMDITQIKIENSHYRNKCRDKLARSPLPAELCKTLQAILSYIGPVSYYTVSFASAETIADKIGVNPRTVERHVQILKAVGLIERDRFSAVAARRVFKERFDYDLKVSTRSIYLTSINRTHPFWQGGPFDVDAFLARLRRASEQARQGQTIRFD